MLLLPKITRKLDERLITKLRKENKELKDDIEVREAQIDLLQQENEELKNE